MSRSRNREILVIRDRQLGKLPSFLELAQRHYEKGQPQGEVASDKTVAFTMPLDMLRLSLGANNPLVDGVEEITVHYRGRG